MYGFGICVDWYVVVFVMEIDNLGMNVCEFYVVVEFCVVVVEVYVGIVYV